ncbi:MAG: S8 family serine peptidase [Verrucomicrobiota bacterium]|nr:S8 family serine peptidase [Verrucomicrobiota bacterium]
MHRWLLTGIFLLLVGGWIFFHQPASPASAQTTVSVTPGPALPSPTRSLLADPHFTASAGQSVTSTNIQSKKVTAEELTHLSTPALAARSISLEEAGQLKHSEISKRLLAMNYFSANRPYTAGLVLVGFRSADETRALFVEEGTEQAAIDSLLKRLDINFAELDTIVTRQFYANDPGYNQQWHHEKIGSRRAWDYSRGNHTVQIAILDAPFQMNHPDLVANTAAGFDTTRNQPVTSSPGITHSTVGAGMAAAVLHNIQGVAGAGNSVILPVDIENDTTLSVGIVDLANGIRWAANNGVRVVNVSWDGAYSSTLNQEGANLKQKNSGLLFMAGVNGNSRLNYPAHSNIIAVAMTDTNDLRRSSWGLHLDFIAPGWEIFSTDVGSSYASDSGTSYATPLLTGIAALLMSINPELTGDQIYQILVETALDLGTTGWDQFYGWGRIDFARAARKTFGTLPHAKVQNLAQALNGIQTGYLPGVSYSLYAAESLMGPWELINEPQFITNENVLTILEPIVSPHPIRFYKTELVLP